MIEVNCIGQKCPVPIINTKKALNQHPTEDLCIRVDNATSCKNLEAYLSDNGIHFTVRQDKDIYTIITGARFNSEVIEDIAPYCPSSESNGYIVVLKSAEMGDGCSDLGAILLKGFLTALSEADKLPEEIICYNGGVLLASDKSSNSESLKKLSERGVKVTLCGTCVDFYGVKDSLLVGDISNMYYILTRLSSNLKIVTP